jgi:hypothetical protein
MISILILYVYALASLAPSVGCNPNANPVVHGQTATQSQDAGGQGQPGGTSHVKLTSVVWGT